MDKLTLKLNDKLVTIEMDDNGRYCLNDIYKASGSDRNKRTGNFLRNTSTSVEVVDMNKRLKNEPLPEDFKSYVVLTGKGRGSKTFAPLGIVYEYAAWISKEFKKAIYSAFTELTIGNVTEAANIASSVALTPEIISRY